MTTTVDHVDTIIVGAGQAGLSLGYHLRRRGRTFLIIDANQRIGDNWRCHWDSLRLYSPARDDGLPGMDFPAHRWSFPSKDDVANLLEAYAAKFDLPVRGGLWARQVSKSGAGYRVDCDDGSFEATNVVVATGTFGRTPFVPEFAGQLDLRVTQLHSSRYKNPSQLQPGPVLVVGASHSGSDIAYELASDHPVILSGRDTGQVPVRLDSPANRVAWPLIFFVFGHVLTRRTPMGRKMLQHERHHGAPFLRVKRSDLAAAGVERVRSRTTGVRDGRPMLADGRDVDVVNVVWCTGFVQDFSWIRLPITGDDGWPIENRGVVDAAPGLYFTGLGFQSSMRSMLIGGAGADADYIAKHIVAHRPVRQLVVSGV
jgi:putative flavoprotein involved in K+ transport